MSHSIVGDTVYFADGTKLSHIHHETQCNGAYCPLHNPSNHEYRDLPLGFKQGHMVRYSPEFPLGFVVDPDDYQFNRHGFAILRNSAKCGQCENELVSQHQHDFVTCECGQLSVDGGNAYLRRIGTDYIETSIIVQREEKEN